MRRLLNLRIFFIFHFLCLASGLSYACRKHINLTIGLLCISSTIINLTKLTLVVRNKETSDTNTIKNGSKHGFEPFFIVFVKSICLTYRERVCNMLHYRV